MESSSFDMARKWLGVMAEFRDGIEYRMRGVLGKKFIADLHENYTAIHRNKESDSLAIKNDQEFEEYLRDITDSQVVIAMLITLWENEIYDTSPHGLVYSSLSAHIIKLGLTKIVELEEPLVRVRYDPITQIEVSNICQSWWGGDAREEVISISNNGKVSIKLYKKHDALDEEIDSDLQFNKTFWLDREEVAVIFSEITDVFRYGYSERENYSSSKWYLKIHMGLKNIEYFGMVVDDNNQRLNFLADLIRKLTKAEFIKTFSLPSIQLLEKVVVHLPSPSVENSQKWIFDKYYIEFFIRGKYSVEKEVSFVIEENGIDIIRNINPNFFGSMVDMGRGHYQNISKPNVKLFYDEGTIEVDYGLSIDFLPNEWNLLRRVIHEMALLKASNTYNQISASLLASNFYSKDEFDQKLKVDDAWEYKTTKGEWYKLSNDITKRFYPSKGGEE